MAHTCTGATPLTEQGQRCTGETGLFLLLLLLCAQYTSVVSPSDSLASSVEIKGRRTGGFPLFLFHPGQRFWQRCLINTEKWQQSVACLFVFLDHKCLVSVFHARSHLKGQGGQSGQLVAPLTPSWIVNTCLGLTLGLSGFPPECVLQGSGCWVSAEQREMLVHPLRSHTRSLSRQLRITRKFKDELTEDFEMVVLEHSAKCKPFGSIGYTFPE